MALPYRYCTVRMMDLHLDLENPRFASSTLVDNAAKLPDEADVIKHLIKYADIESLANNINRTKYLHGSEIITCYEDNSGKLIVAEGNRRVCACKLLLDRTLIPKDSEDSFPKASQETIENIKSVTINLYESKESVQSYLSDRHISGVKKWSALEKNNYYMNLFQQYRDVGIVKTYTSDSLGTVKNSIIKYQFFMSVFKILKDNGCTLEIEKIDYLPLVDRFMSLLVSNDPDVGLSLKLDKEKLVYLCPDNKREKLQEILLLVGKAFLVWKNTDINPGVIGSDVANKPLQKALILEDKRIPGLHQLIKEFKEIDGKGFAYSAGESEILPKTKTPSKTNITAYDPVIPAKYVPKKIKREYLSFSNDEAKDFIFDDIDYDIKIQEIIHELAVTKVTHDPVACACLYRCLLEMCARRVFTKRVKPTTKTYNEGNLAENLLYITNNVLFVGLTGSEWEKKRKAIKDRFGKDGVIDVLNLYIHYPQMVDTTYLVDSWSTTKLFIERSLSI